MKAKKVLVVFLTILALASICLIGSGCGIFVKDRRETEFDGGKLSMVTRCQGSLRICDVSCSITNTEETRKIATLRFYGIKNQSGDTYSDSIVGALDEGRSLDLKYSFEEEDKMFDFGGSFTCTGSFGDKYYSLYYSFNE